MSPAVKQGRQRGAEQIRIECSEEEQIYSLACSLVCMLVCLSVCPFDEFWVVCLSMRSLVRLFVRAFDCSFVYL